MVQYSQTGDPSLRTGTVVAEHGDWFVIKADNYANDYNPFVIKRGADIELA